jgi:protein-L-isoaspartate O-methyltransferase
MHSDLSRYRIQYARAFDECADKYHGARLRYPDTLFSDLAAMVAAGPGNDILEVGAGSGGATVVLASAGFSVHCIEPSRRMASVLKLNCSAFQAVKVSTTSFEHWRPRSQYSALVAAQSWHLIDPASRLLKAAQVIRQGGLIALLWSQPPQPVDNELRVALDNLFTTYEGNLAAAPGSKPTPMPHHPSLSTSPYFAARPPRIYVTSNRITHRSYMKILETYPEYFTLPVARQEALSCALRDQVFSSGTVESTSRTMLHSAFRTSSEVTD